jgi:hypothetical protein
LHLVCESKPHNDSLNLTAGAIDRGFEYLLAEAAVQVVPAVTGSSRRPQVSSKAFYESDRQERIRPQLTAACGS